MTKMPKAVMHKGHKYVLAESKTKKVGGVTFTNEGDDVWTGRLGLLVLSVTKAAADRFTTWMVVHEREHTGTSPGEYKTLDKALVGVVAEGKKWQAQMKKRANVDALPKAVMHKGQVYVLAGDPELADYEKAIQALIKNPKYAPLKPVFVKGTAKIRGAGRNGMKGTTIGFKTSNGFLFRLLMGKYDGKWGFGYSTYLSEEDREAVWGSVGHSLSNIKGAVQQARYFLNAALRLQK